MDQMVEHNLPGCMVALLEECNLFGCTLALMVDCSHFDCMLVLLVDFARCFDSLVGTYSLEAAHSLVHTARSFLVEEEELGFDLETCTAQEVAFDHSILEVQLDVKFDVVYLVH
jgi:hypothetical protein